MPASVLVTGGAGYIGSHTAHQLINAGNRVVVIDKLHTRHTWAVRRRATFLHHDVGDTQYVLAAMRQRTA